MLDFGWSELFLVIAVAILVIGPQDIPKAMLTLGKLVRRFQYMKFALSQQFEDMMKEADLAELRHVNESAAEEPVPDEAAADAEEESMREEESDDDDSRTATRH